jgi:hypothetical protein
VVTRNRGRGVAQAPPQVRLATTTRAALYSIQSLSLESPQLQASQLGRRSAAGCACVEGSRSKPRRNLRFKSEAGALATKARAAIPHAEAAWCQRCPPPKVLANPSLEPGPPPASHLARAPASVIIRRAGQAPSRLRPLSSNVRPRSQRLGHRHQPNQDSRDAFVDLGFIQSSFEFHSKRRAHTSQPAGSFIWPSS